jgi:hypothetical protein
MKLGLYTFVIETHLNRAILSAPFEFGWGMGYILLPFTHPFYGKDYDDIDINIHGGLTFAQLFNSTKFLEWINNREIIGDVTIDNYEKFNDYWIIGFDTNHFGDNLYICSKEYVINETNLLLEQCLDDRIKEIRRYKYKFLRRDKLKDINASVIEK